MRDVIVNLVEALDRGLEMVVCQVVDTRGSTPQKAGALMTVDGHGQQRGTLGGGCVENEVRHKAHRGLAEAQTAVHTFVLDHDYAWADGLICGGKMTILTQPARGAEAAAYFRAWIDAIDAGQGFREIIALETREHGLDPGARILMGPAGEPLASLPAGLSAPPGLTLEPVADRPRALVKDGLAILPSPPRIRLVIVGAGHVGQAVAKLANEVDFDVCVVDDRAQFANRERFPEAKEILVGPIEATLEGLTLNPSTYALIVTRGHGHDQEALERLASTRAGYVGLIGSKRKIRLIFESLLDRGVSRAALERVFAPVGIEIGSQTVPEIAVSIVAELISWRNLGRKPAARGPLDRFPSGSAGGLAAAGAGS